MDETTLTPCLDAAAACTGLPKPLLLSVGEPTLTPDLDITATCTGLITVLLLNDDMATFTPGLDETVPWKGLLTAVLVNVDKFILALCTDLPTAELLVLVIVDKAMLTPLCVVAVARGLFDLETLVDTEADLLAL